MEPFDAQFQATASSSGEFSETLHQCDIDRSIPEMHHEARRQERLASAYAKLHEFSTGSCPSRPSSPRSIKAHQHYLEDMGSRERPTCDTLIVNVFIGLFQTYVAPTFPCFQSFRITTSTPEELYLIMAAVGGLYCDVPRSEMVAKWLQNDARKKLLTAVSYA